MVKLSKFQMPDMNDFHPLDVVGTILARRFKMLLLLFLRGNMFKILRIKSVFLPHHCSARPTCSNCLLEK